jgi:hypothetical protein
VTVNPGITLTVEAGVIVMGSPSTTLGVYGYFQAIGSLASPITFTSSTDTGPGEWDGIGFVGGSSHLNHVVLRNGGSVDIKNLESDAVIIIENSIFRDNDDYPITLHPQYMHQLQITNSQFISNTPNRIRIFASDNNRYLDGNVVLSPLPGLEGYEMTNSWLDVPAGITLTLKPGVTMMVSRLFMEGRLYAIGTPDVPISFTSSEAFSPQDGWIGFRGDSSHLNHVIVQNMAGIAVETIEQPNAEVTIENSVFQDNFYYPLFIQLTNLHQINLSNLTFLANKLNRILVFADNQQNELAGNVTLMPHLGLESYEIAASGSTDDELVIPSGITLTVQPNVGLMFQNENGALLVNGRLRTLGTATQPITLTSVASTGPDEWGGLIFDGGEGELQHTTVRYGKSNIAVVGDTAVVTLTHTQVMSGLTGLAVEEGVVTAVCSTFSQNQNNGIHILYGGNPSVNIFSSSINDNDGTGLNNESGTLVKARYNWWGDASGPGGIGSGNGDIISGAINYKPWLTAPDCVSSIVETAVIYLPFITLP